MGCRILIVAWSEYGIFVWEFFGVERRDLCGGFWLLNKGIEWTECGGKDGDRR